MSTVVADVVLGSPRAGVVLGSFPRALYLLLEQGRVLALVTDDAVRLPNALVLRRDAGEEPFAATPAGAPAWAGDGRVVAGDVVVTAGGWWDPVPRLGAVDGATVAANAAVSTPHVDHAGGRHLRDGACGTGYPTLTAAAARFDAVDGAAAAARLVGAGPGLTPAGDDLLGGTIAASLLLGEAVGNRRAMRFAGDLAAAAAEHAQATTRISASLLHHAAGGAVAERVASLLRALAGHDDPARATVDLLAVGHTSGSDLAAGVLLGARAVAGVLPSAPDRDRLGHDAT